MQPTTIRTVPVVSACGRARFTALTSQLIRLEWSMDGGFEDRPSIHFVQRDAGDPGHVKIRYEESTLVMETEHLTLRYGNLPIETWDGQLSVTINTVGTRGAVVWEPGMHDEQNLLGTTRTLDGVSGATHLHPGLVSRSGWAVYDDSHSPLLSPIHVDAVDSKCEPSMWANDLWPIARPPSDRKDWYFFGHGHHYTQALKDYTEVAGKVPLPPKWSFGAWWSRYWPYTDDEFKALVKEFEDHDVPLDVLVLDMDWHKEGWTGYSWNPDCFKDPEDFLTWCADQGLAVTLNLHPADGVGPHETAYRDVCQSLGKQPGGQVIPFDVTDIHYMHAYFKYLHHPLEKQGVSFWWIDWQQGDRSKIRGLDPMFWLNHLHCVDMEKRGKRSLILSRWAGLGGHRYQIGFSGDTYSNWDSLQFQIKMTATAGNVCYPYWSHDIGGHFPGAVDPEVFVRWIQWAVFNPFLRTHSTRSELAERRIWGYPAEYFSAARAAFHLRYSLIPYIYTTARQCYDTALPLNRPLYYDWPEFEEAYNFETTYMFGPSLLCCPVASAIDTTTGVATVHMWFPPGRWYHLFTGQRVDGPCTSVVSASLDSIPVFVKGGAVLPQAPKVSRSRDKTAEPITLTVFPGPASSYRLYDDDGSSNAYQGAAGQWTAVDSSCEASGVTVAIHPPSSAWVGNRAEVVRVRIRGVWPPSAVTFNDVPLAATSSASDATTPCWWYDCKTFSVNVQCFWPKYGSSTVTIRVALSSLSTSLIDGGLSGKIALIDRIVDALGEHCPPEVTEFQELIQAVELSCILSPDADVARELSESLQGLWADRLPSAATALLLAGSSNKPVRGAAAFGYQLLTASDARGGAVIRRFDPYVCTCRDPSTGEPLVFSPDERQWMKWVKTSNGYLVPHLPPATDKPMVWSEFDDHGKHFADFEEVSHAGNCRKCASVVIFDKRRSMYVRMLPHELAWSGNAATWHTISPGKWTDLKK